MIFFKYQQDNQTFILTGQTNCFKNKVTKHHLKQQAKQPFQSKGEISSSLDKLLITIVFRYQTTKIHTLDAILLGAGASLKTFSNLYRVRQKFPASCSTTSGTIPDRGPSIHILVSNSENIATTYELPRPDTALNLLVYVQRYYLFLAVLRFYEQYRVHGLSGSSIVTTCLPLWLLEFLSIYCIIYITSKKSNFLWLNFLVD